MFAILRAGGSHKGEQILREYHAAHPQPAAEDVTLSPLSSQAQWTIVWLCDKEWERQFFEKVMLAPFLNSREVAPEACTQSVQPCLGDGVVLIVGRHSYKEDHKHPRRYLEAARELGIPSIVLHISDEQCDMETSWYELPTLVLRQYWCNRSSTDYGEHVVTMPDGLKNGWDYRHPIIPSGQRKCTWSFYGHIGGDRTEVRTAMRDEMLRVPSLPECKPEMMEDAMDTLKIEGAAYTAAMCNTVFAPCPRGFGLETFRFNEALECGAIPIVDDGGRVFHRYMPGILEHVITTDAKWTHTTHGRRISEVVSELLANPVALERKRLALLQWYHNYRRGLLHRMQRIVDATGPRQNK